jgi:hypothetical protein
METVPAEIEIGNGVSLVDLKVLVHEVLVVKGPLDGTTATLIRLFILTVLLVIKTARQRKLKISKDPTCLSVGLLPE